MRAHRYERFLGVPADAEAWTLLGLGDDVTLDGPMIDRALRARLTMVNRHPGSDSTDAEALREALQRAATELREQIGKQVQRTPSPARRAAQRPPTRTPNRSPMGPALTLTEFDRQVLGTLVGSGGWNHDSRARLVSIAAAHRVTVHGLLTVIRGLNEYARSGGALLDVSTITAGKRMLTPSSVDLPRRGPSLAERLLPELKDPTPATTVKWSLIFGMMAVVLGGALILLIVTGGGEPEVAPPVIDDAPPPAIAQQDHTDTTMRDPALGRTPATFPQPPTFAVPLEDVVPDELLAQADKLPEEFDHVARRVSVSDEPAEAVFREWEALIDIASSVWVGLDKPFNRQVAASVKRVFEESVDKPAASNRLLDAVGVGAGQYADPLETWRSTWRIQRLVELTQSLRLTPELRERSERLLTAALAQAVDTRTLTPPEVASLWLGDITELLMDRTESTDHPYEMWTIWLAAVERTAEGDARNELIARAAESILSRHTDLTHQKPTVNVLGRLLEELDWSGSRLVKQRFTAWFEANGGITSEDLWVVTSILVTHDLAPWLEESLILPAGADEAHRRRVRDQIASAWPALGDDGTRRAGPAGRALDVDPELSPRWRDLHAMLLTTTPVSAPPALAQHLALLARLNEAASLLERHETTDAERVMDWIDRAAASASVLDTTLPPGMSRGTQVAGQRLQQPGQSIGQDGVWAAAYAQAGMAADGRINLLRSLRSTAGTDLGPVDAATFVREVYRATPGEVRAMAQSVAMMFVNGPNVSQQLLDQLPDAVPNEDTSEFLSRFTGRSMPAARSERWRIDTRLILIEHCLSLMRTTETDIDRAAEIVANAVAHQGPGAPHELAQQAVHASPAEAAEHVRQAWADALRRVVVAEPVPGSVDSIERGHRSRKQLADGPIQSFLASRIGHLELFALALTAEQPTLRVTVAGMLNESEAKRAQLPDALQQAIEVERALAHLHALRMRDVTHETPEDEDGRGQP